MASQLPHQVSASAREMLTTQGDTNITSSCYSWVGGIATCLSPDSHGLPDTLFLTPQPVDCGQENTELKTYHLGHLQSN